MRLTYGWIIICLLRLSSHTTLKLTLSYGYILWLKYYFIAVNLHWLKWLIFFLAVWNAKITKRDFSSWFCYLRIPCVLFCLLYNRIFVKFLKSFYLSMSSAGVIFGHLQRVVFTNYFSNLDVSLIFELRVH